MKSQLKLIPFHMALLGMAIGGALFCTVTTVHAAPVKVRAADHEGFSRVVFDWPGHVPYTVENQANEITVHFQSEEEPDLSGVSFINLRYIHAGIVRREDDGYAVSFTLEEDVNPRHFVVGSKVIIDVRSQDVATAVPGSAPSALAEVVPSALRDAAEKMNAQDREQAEKEALRERFEREQSIEAARRVLKQNFDSQVPQPLIISGKADTDALRLDVPARKGDPIAVFRRGKWLWIVLGGQANVQHPDLEGAASKRIISGEQIPDRNITAVRYKLKDDQFVDVLPGSGGWSIYVRDTLVFPSNPIVPERHIDPITGPRLFLATGEKAVVFEVQDPDVGDRIVIFPSDIAGQGVSEPRRFADFTVLQSAQGAALVSLSENVEALPIQGGVAIASSAGLGVLNAARQVEARADLDKPKQFVDYVTWRQLGGKDNEGEREDALLYALSIADVKDVNERRWDLARFYLATGRPDAAIGILKLMVEKDPDVEKSPDFRAVRGVAQLNLRRFELAEKDLSIPKLEREEDAALWRVLVYDALGKPEEALNDYRTGIPALTAYNIDDQARFTLAAARSALNLGQNSFVEQEIGALRALGLSPYRQAEAQLLQAKLSHVYKDFKSAHDGYLLLSETAPRPVAAHAQFEEVKLRLDEGSLSNLEAINVIEGMRYAWRGDVFELELLERLGQLHVAENEYRLGLEKLRQAANYFKEDAKVKAITRQMEEIFQGLYLGDKSDEMEPLQAVALYYDFQELTPLGAQGDRMVRRLVDRMVSVDLLDRAAGLLEHQIKFRLEGVAQAVVASRLAFIHLLDNKPENALDVLRATKVIQQMPDDLRRQRNQLEARALIDLDRYDEAEAVLEDDRSVEASVLRADLYWGAKRWNAIIQSFSQDLDARWQGETPLTMDEQRQVLRTAVAMTMTDKEGELRRLRRRYEAVMAGGPLNEAFLSISGTSGLDPDNLRSAVSKLADVDRLESFMANYRKAYEASDTTI